MKVIDMKIDVLYFRKLRHIVEVAWLYLFHLLTGRRLELLFLSKPGSLIFTNGYFTLHWKIKGCHQVTINNNMVLPGNISYIRLDPMQLKGSLDLRFRGYQQTIVKTYTISPLHLQTKQLTNILLQETKLQVPELKGHKESLLSSGSNLALSSIHFPDTLQLQTRSDLLSIHTAVTEVLLEPCELPDYNP